MLEVPEQIQAWLRSATFKPASQDILLEPPVSRERLVALTERADRRKERQASTLPYNGAVLIQPKVPLGLETLRLNVRGPKSGDSLIDAHDHNSMHVSVWCYLRDEYRARLTSALCLSEMPPGNHSRFSEWCRVEVPHFPETRLVFFNRLVVDPDHDDLGLGPISMVSGLQWSMRAGFTGALLVVIKENLNARKIFEWLGFQQVKGVEFECADRPNAPALTVVPYYYPLHSSAYGYHVDLAAARAYNASNWQGVNVSLPYRWDDAFQWLNVEVIS